MKMNIRPICSSGVDAVENDYVYDDKCITKLSVAMKAKMVNPCNFFLGCHHHHQSGRKSSHQKGSQKMILIIK